MPSRDHSWVQTMLIGELLAHRDKITPFSELALETRPTFTTPDISIYAAFVPAKEPAQIRETEPPLVTVEILSPTQGYLDVSNKVAIYFTHGVKACWVLDPFSESLTVHLPGQAPRTFSACVYHDPLLDIDVDLRKVFVWR